MNGIKKIISMSLSINRNITNSNVFSAFKTNSPRLNLDGISAHNITIKKNTKGSIYPTLTKRRNHRLEEPDTKQTVITAVAATIATILPMVYFAKKQNGLKKFTDLFKVEYNLKEVLALSASSIVGGAVTGMLVDKKTNRKRKMNEAVFQFMNSILPTAFVGGVLELVKDNVKYKNSKAVKVAAIAIALIAGMPTAAWLSNMINDPKDKEPDRKLHLKDAIINMDDAIGALIVAKVPLVEQLHLDKLMPAIFAWCGYRAGQSN